MPPEPRVPPDTEWVFKQFLYEDVLRDLNDLFQHLGINYMPIKGAYLIASGCAGKFTNRTMVDIDILVLQKDFPEVVLYFKNVNGVEVKPNYWPFEFSFCFPCKKATVFVEIHSLLNYPERFLLPTEALFARAVSQKQQCLLPCVEDSLIIFLCHLLVHIPFEIRKTVFQEIEILSNQEDFSWEKFWNLSTQTGIQQFFNMLLIYYSKLKKEKVPLKNPSLYAKLLASIGTRKVYESMPVWMRRLFLEIPFVRNPLKLIWGKQLA
jgi:hypothetical protein